jgi:hypothetical protein
MPYSTVELSFHLMKPKDLLHQDVLQHTRVSDLRASDEDHGVKWKKGLEGAKLPECFALTQPLDDDDGAPGGNRGTFELPPAPNQRNLLGGLEGGTDQRGVTPINAVE